MADFDNWLWGLGQTESSNNYKAVGPQTKRGRALGRYQVMEGNVGPWTEQATGQRLTPEQFLASPQAQDAVANHIGGQYFDKYGPAGAASMWFSGRPNAGANVSDGYVSAPGYVSRVLANMSKAPGADAGSAPVGMDPSDPIGFAGDAPQPAQGTNAFDFLNKPKQPGGVLNNVDFSTPLVQAGAALAGISNPEQGQALGQIANQMLTQRMRAQEQNKPQYQTMQDGTVIQINPLTGAVKPVFKGAEKLEQVKDQDILGGTHTTFQSPFRQPGQPAGAAVPAGGGAPSLDPTLTGDAARTAIQKTYPQVSNQVDAIANYKLAPLAQGRGNKAADGIMNMVQMVNPNYNAGYWKDIQDANYDVGPKGNTGKKMIAMNNAGQHLAAASDLALEVEPGTNIVPWNRIAQAFGKDYQGKTGVTNFQTMANIAGTEVAKALHGVGSVGEKDEETWRSYLSSAQTPGQLQQRLNELGQAIHVQEGNSYHAYEVGTHGVVKYSDQHPQPLLSPEASAGFDRIRQRAEASKQPPPPAANRKPLGDIFK